MNEKINVLIVSAIPTHFKEMRRVARLLQRSNYYRPIIFFQQPYQNILGDMNTCQNDGIQYQLNFKHHSSSGTEQPRSIFVSILKACNKIKAPRLLLYSNTVLGFFGNLMYFAFKKCWQSPFLSKLPGVRKIKEGYVNILEAIHRLDIGLIVLPEENILYLSPFYIAGAQSRRIPVVIVPFTIANTQEFAETFYPLTAYHTNTLVNSMTSRLFPQWVMQYKDKNIIFPAQYIMAYEYLNISPLQPWVLNGNDASAILVESEFMNQYYLSSGIKPERLTITGTLYDDELYHHQKMMHPSSAKPILLCALPPDQFNLNRPDLEFADYQALIKYLFELFSVYQDTYQVIFNPHPRSHVNSSLVEAYSDITVSPDDVTSLIVRSDLYIAFSSATIRMAITLGIPVVNYDVYHYRYSDFKTAPGVMEVSTRNEFESSLADVCLNKAKYNLLKEKQLSVSSQWGMLDGKSGERMIAALGQLIQCHSAQWPHKK